MRMVSIDFASLRDDDKVFFQQYLKVLKKRVIDLAAFATDDGKVLLFVYGLRSSVVEAHLEPLRSPVQNIRLTVEDVAPQLPRLVARLRDSAAAGAPSPMMVAREAASWQEIDQAARALEQADLSQMLFNQAAFALAEKGGVPLYTELFVSIGEVEKLAGAKSSFTANRWAFRDLTLTLDRLVLKRFNKSPDDIPGSPFSLNLNVASLFSEAFVAFAEGLPTQRFGTVMVEIHRADAFEDLERFEVACSYLHDHGLVVALDGIDFSMLPLVDYRALGVDFLKLTWNERFLEADDAAARRTREALPAIGVPVILTRCDHAQALAFARDNGIGVVQGRIIEKLLGAELVRQGGEVAKPGSIGNPFLIVGREGVPTFGLLVQ